MKRKKQVGVGSVLGESLSFPGGRESGVLAGLYTRGYVRTPDSIGAATRESAYDAQWNNNAFWKGTQINASVQRTSELKNLGRVKI